jgi:cytochrome c553
MACFASRVLAVSLLLASACAGVQALEPSSGDQAATLYQNVCATCHGIRGEGRVELKAPSIAGLPDWYARGQLESFRADRRGTHEKDPEGQMMRAVSKVLTEAQVKAMARHVAAMPRVTPVPTIVADVTAGRELYAERCMECHRYNAEGELFFSSPPLVGLQDWYLASQIRKYQEGIRGVHPKDVNGQKMVFSSGFVENQEVLHSLVAYLMELQKPKAAETASKQDDPFHATASEK